MGWFKGEKALVQCPGPDSWVAFSIFAPQALEEVKLAVLDVSKNYACHRGIKKGDIIEFSKQYNNNFCPYALNTLFPILLNMALYGQWGTVPGPVNVACAGCSMCKNRTTFQLECIDNK